MGTKSLIIDVFEGFLQSELSASQSEQIESLSVEDGIELASEIDKTLEAERLEVLPLAQGSLPLPYTSTYGPDWLVDEEGRCARLSLLHRNVYVPVGALSDSVWTNYDSDDDGRLMRSLGIEPYDASPLLVIHEWLIKNELLVRSGALVPFNHEVYWTRAVDNACYAAADKFDVSDAIARVSDFAPVVSDMPVAERIETIKAQLFPLFRNLFLANRLRLTPSAIDYPVCNLWDLVISKLGSASRLSETRSRTDHVFTELELPQLEGLPQAEICALHRNSEAFAKWRERLEAVLRRVDDRAKGGAELQKTFEEELLPLREAAWAIQKEVKDSSVLTRLKKGTIAVGLGALAICLSGPIIELAGGGPSTLKDVIKLGPGFIVPFLWALFTEKKQDSGTVLRFYEAITAKQRG